MLATTIWSLQPHRRGAGEQTELYNVDRVSKSEGLDGLPSDYSKLPRRCRAGAAAAGRPWPRHREVAAAGDADPYAPPGHDPDDARRKEAEAAAASSVFFRSRTQAGARRASGASRCGWPASALAGFDPLAAGRLDSGPACRPTAVQNRQDQKEAFLKGGSTETRNSGNLQMPSSPYQVMAGTVIAGRW